MCFGRRGIKFQCSFSRFIGPEKHKTFFSHGSSPSFYVCIVCMRCTSFVALLQMKRKENENGDPYKTQIPEKSANKTQILEKGLMKIFY